MSRFPPPGNRPPIDASRHVAVPETHLRPGPTGIVPAPDRDATANPAGLRTRSLVHSQDQGQPLGDPTPPRLYPMAARPTGLGLWIGSQGESRRDRQKRGLGHPGSGEATWLVLS